MRTLTEYLNAIRRFQQPFNYEDILRRANNDLITVSMSGLRRDGGGVFSRLFNFDNALLGLNLDLEKTKELLGAEIYETHKRDDTLEYWYKHPTNNPLFQGWIKHDPQEIKFIYSGPHQINRVFNLVIEGSELSRFNKGYDEGKLVEVSIPIQTLSILNLCGDSSNKQHEESVLNILEKIRDAKIQGFYGGAKDFHAVINI